MKRLRMVDILKRIGTGILLSLFVLSAHEDSFALSFNRTFSEDVHQGAVSDTIIPGNDSGRTDSYDAVCGSQHSGRLPCGNDCQFTGCLNVAIIPWKGSAWKKYGAKLPFSGTLSVFRPSVPELTRSPHSRYTFSDVPNKNSYASLVGIIKNLN